MHLAILQELAAERVTAIAAEADEPPARSASWPMARVARRSHAGTVPTAKQGQERVIDMAPVPAEANQL